MKKEEAKQILLEHKAWLEDWSGIEISPGYHCRQIAEAIGVILEHSEAEEKELIRKGRAEALEWVHGSVSCGYCDSSDLCVPGKKCYVTLLEKMQQEVGDGSIDIIASGAKDTAPV